jgi:hypothetical protein
MHITLPLEQILIEKETNSNKNNNSFKNKATASSRYEDLEL